MHKSRFERIQNSIFQQCCDLIRSPISPARPLPTVNVNEDVEMVPAEDRQRVREVLARVNIPDAVELASSSSGLASMKQPIVNNNHIVAAPQNNNQHRVCQQQPAPSVPSDRPLR